MVQERARKPAARRKAAVEVDDGQAQVNWFVSSPPELEPYRGMWVAVVNFKVVASGATAMEVYEQLNRTRTSGALLAVVPRADEPEYFIG